MKLNKILAMLLALVMVFSLAACGKGSAEGDGKILNVHVTAAIDSIDPHLTSAGLFRRRDRCPSTGTLKSFAHYRTGKQPNQRSFWRRTSPRRHRFAVDGRSRPNPFGRTAFGT